MSSVLLCLFVSAYPAIADYTYESDVLDGVFYWKSTSPFHTTIGNTYGSVYSMTGTYMQCKLVIHDATPNAYNTIFRVSTQTTYVGGCDRGLPSLWLTSDRHLKIGIADADCFGNYAWWTHLMLFDTVYEIVVHFNASHIYTSINNEPYYDGARPTPSPSLQLNTWKYVLVDVDETGTYPPTANATLYDIILLSYDQQDPFPQQLLDDLQAVSTTTTTTTTTASAADLTTQFQETYSTSQISAVEPITTSQITDEQDEGGHDVETQSFPFVFLIILIAAGFLMILVALLLIWWYWKCQEKRRRETQYSNNLAVSKPITNVDSQVELNQRQIVNKPVNQIRNDQQDNRFGLKQPGQSDERPTVQNAHIKVQVIGDFNMPNNDRPNLNRLQLSAGSDGDSLFEKPEGHKDSLRSTVTFTNTTHGQI